MEFNNCGIVNDLACRRSQLITLIFLGLEQKVQLFQRLSIRLWEEDIDEHNLKT